MQFVIASEQAQGPSDAAWHVSNTVRQKATTFRTIVENRNILAPTIIESEWVGITQHLSSSVVLFYGHRHLVIVVVLDLETY